jgi:hypothetical protein
MQRPTFIVLNLTLAGVLILLTTTLVSGSVSAEVAPHLAILLFLACGLAISINW